MLTVLQEVLYSKQCSYPRIYSLDFAARIEWIRTGRRWCCWACKCGLSTCGESHSDHKMNETSNCEQVKIVVKLQIWSHPTRQTCFVSEYRSARHQMQVGLMIQLAIGSSHWISVVSTNCYELLVTATRHNLFPPTLRFSYESQIQEVRLFFYDISLEE